MTCFPDVNVWLALTVNVHAQHHAARSWLNESKCDRFAFSRVTQMGLLRLLTNPAVMNADVMTPLSAWQRFENLMKDDGIVFLSEPPGIEESWKGFAATQHPGPNHWTDSYLAAFVERTGH